MKIKEIEETIAAFRPMGFFGTEGKRSNAELAKDLAERPDEWQGPLLEYEPDAEDPAAFRDLGVLVHDSERVWRLESWEVLLNYSYAKKNGYACCRNYTEVLKNLVRLCAHRFKLSCTEARGGTMTLKIGRRTQRIQFRTDGGVFSTDFLAKVNEVLADTGHEFVLVSNRFCQGYLLLISHEEKARLQRERSWEWWPLGE
jgi:hypothetical protein